MSDHRNFGGHDGKPGTPSKEQGEPVEKGPANENYATQRVGTYVRTKDDGRGRTYVRKIGGSGTPAANDNGTPEQDAPLGMLRNVSDDGGPDAKQKSPSGGYRVASDLPDSLPVLEGEAALVAAFWEEFIARLPANDDGP